MISLETILTLVATIAGTFGGLEAVKYFLHRGQHVRIKEAEADSAEFTLLRETVEFLQAQLRSAVEADAEKEARFVEQTKRLRQVQDELSELQREKARVELEAQMFRCVVKRCPNREPPNGY